MPKSRIQQLLDTPLADIQRFSYDQMEAAFRDIQRKANARYDRINKKNNARWKKFSHAVTRFEDNGGKLTNFTARQFPKGSEEARNALYWEIKRGWTYLNSQTSSISGVKQWRNNTIRGLADSFDKIYGFDPTHRTELETFFARKDKSPVDDSWTYGDERLNVMVKLMDKLRKRQQEKGVLYNLSSDTLVVMAYEYVQGDRKFITPQELENYVDDVIDEMKKATGKINNKQRLTPNHAVINVSAVEFGRELIRQKSPPTVTGGWSDPDKWRPIPEKKSPYAKK